MLSNLESFWNLPFLNRTIPPGKLCLSLFMGHLMPTRLNPPEPDTCLAHYGAELNLTCFWLTLPSIRARTTSREPGGSIPKKQKKTTILPHARTGWKGCFLISSWVFF